MQQEIVKFYTENALYIWVILSGTLKKLLPHLKSAVSNFSKYNVSRKNKKAWNLGLNISYFGIFKLY